MPASHSLGYRVHTRALLTLVLLLIVVTGLLAEPPHRVLLRDAAAAAKSGDDVTALAKLERAAKLAPDYPRIYLELARLHVRQHDTAAAITALRTLAEMGLGFNLDQDPALDSLRAEPAFARLREAFAANTTPIAGADETRRSIEGVTGIIESVATHPLTRETFLGDVRNRCLWRLDDRAHGGALEKFSTDNDGLLGVFAVKFSADGQTLWASCSAVPAMQGYRETDQGSGFLAEYDLAGRKLRRLHRLPEDGRPHVLGDFALAVDGTIYVTDSAAPVIWRLLPGADALESWLSYPWFVSLQGVALSSNGRQLYVADYANGIWRIDADSRQAAILRAPARGTLFGIDGLYVAPDALIAVQNGVNPQRILHLALTPAGEIEQATVLAQDTQNLPDLALGQVRGNRFEFVGNSGWALFEDPSATPAPRTVALHAIGLVPARP